MIYSSWHDAVRKLGFTRQCKFEPGRTVSENMLLWVVKEQYNMAYGEIGGVSM